MGSPVYIQIHNQIKKDIEAGVWAVGDRIPSEHELALEFNVSRICVRRFRLWSKKESWSAKSVPEPLLHVKKCRKK